MVKETSNRDGQIASSNSTMNMFLGGGRQPSWLISGEDQNHQTTTLAATTRRAAPQGNKTRNRENVHRPETDRDASSSTSPFLANSMAPPQPQSSNHHALSPPLTPAFSADTPPADFIPQSRDETPSHTNEDINRKKRNVQPATASPKRRRVEETIQQQQQQTTPPNTSHLNGSTVANGHRVESGNPSNGFGQIEQGDTLHTALQAAEQQLLNEQAEARYMARLATQHQQEQYQSPNFSHAPMQMPMAPPTSRRTSATPAVQQGAWMGPQMQTQSLNLGQHAQFVPNTNQVLRSQSQPVQVPVRQGIEQFLLVNPFTSHAPYNRDGCTGILEDFVKSRGGITKFGSTERLRIQVLQEAVQHNDWIFLFLHHIISQHFLNPGFVPPGISSTPNFSDAAHIMNLILGTADLQDPSMINFFATFPCQLGLSLSFSPTKQDGLVLLNWFIPHLHQLWQDLQTECRQRRYPPTIPEMAGGLKLISPTFMRIFFTAARRMAWPCENEQQEQGVEMNRIFQDADSVFARSRDAFFYAFDMYQEMDEIRDYQRLQANFFYLLQLSPGQIQQSRNQPAQMQQNPRQLQHPGHPQGQMQGMRDAASIQPRQINPAPRPNLQVTIGQQPSRLLSQHNSPLPSTIPSPRKPPVAVFGAPGVLGSPRLHMSQSPATPVNHDQRVTRVRPQHAGPPATCQRSAHSRFMPGVNDPPPPQPAQPNAAMSALHQAHLREPILTQASQYSGDSLPPVLYQMVAYYLLPPRRLEADSLVQKWTFDLCEEEFNHIAITVPAELGQRSTRILAEDSHQYRLRCSRIGRAQDSPIKVNDWAVSDTSFPIYMYLILNGKTLEIRRKLHHGKDMPIDLTEYLVAGENKLQVLLNTHPEDADASNYALAIETIGVKFGESIVQQCKTRMRKADDVLLKIKSSLSSSDVADDDDDDLIMVSGNVTIDMVDPITQSNSFTLPVRGIDCTHWSCFDLAKFLESRVPAEQTRTGEKPRRISAVDVWRCPICRGDARPQNLIADGFVWEAYKKLVEDGKHKTRAIIVEADGTWRPKPEKVKDGGSSSRSRQTTLSAPSHQGSPLLQHAANMNQSDPTAQTTATNWQSATPPVTRKPVEIVDLGSDSD